MLRAVGAVALVTFLLFPAYGSWSQHQPEGDFGCRIVTNAYLLPIAGVHATVDTAVGLAGLSFGLTGDVPILQPRDSSLAVFAQLSREWLSVGLRFGIDPADEESSGEASMEARFPALPVTVGPVILLPKITLTATAIEAAGKSYSVGNSIGISGDIAALSLDGFLRATSFVGGFDAVSVVADGDDPGLNTWFEVGFDLSWLNFVSTTDFSGVFGRFISESLTILFPKANLSITGTVAVPSAGAGLVVSLSADYALGDLGLLHASAPSGGETVVCNGNTCIVVEW